MQVEKFVLPGDLLTDVRSLKGVTVIGPGLRRNEERPNTLYATTPGNLRFKPPNSYWVEARRNRYVPKKGDLVVGIITKKSGDSLRVDVGSAEFAHLSLLAFEGATKKQKPDAQIGDLVYAKVLNAHKEMEPELVCIDSYSKAGRLGLLSNEGFLVGVSPTCAMRLLDINNPLLRTLGRKLVYEIVVGANGKVWINTRNTKDVFKIVKCLEIAAQESDAHILEACRKIK